MFFAALTFATAAFVATTAGPAAAATAAAAHEYAVALPPHQRIAFRREPSSEYFRYIKLDAVLLRVLSPPQLSYKLPTTETAALATQEKRKEVKQQHAAAGEIAIRTLRETKEERRRNAITSTATGRRFASRACLSITESAAASSPCDTVLRGYIEDRWRLPAPGSVTAVTVPTEPVTSCGGEYVPPGGVLGDLTADLYVPFARPNVSSLVFRLPPPAVQRIATLNGSEIHLCVFPRSMTEGVQDVGQLKLIEANLTISGGHEEAEKEGGQSHGFSLPPGRDMVVTVRSFLQPGWSFIYDVPGGSEDSVVALKAHSCNDFADSHAYQIATALSAAALPDADEATRLATAEATTSTFAPPLWRFEFRADFREETSTLSNWRLYCLTRRRLIPKAAEQPFSAAGTAGVAPPKLHNVALAAAAVAAEPAAAFDAADWPAFDTTATMDIRHRAQRRVQHRVEEAAEYIVRFQLCYYPTASDSGGVPLGSVIFHSDKADSMELVAFVVFTVVGIPFLLGLTVSCYGYKHRKLRRSMRRHRLMLRREEIEERLLRQLGVDLVGETDDDDDDDDDDGDGGDGRERHRDDRRGEQRAEQQPLPPGTSAQPLEELQK